MSVAIGFEAKEVLDTDAFIKATENLKARYAADWMNSKPKASEERELLFAKAQVVDAVVKELRVLMNAATMSERFNGN